MVDYRLIGSRLKKFREIKNYTQETVAEKAEITVVYLSKIENGKARPTLDTLSNLCTILDCDLGEILLHSSLESNYYQTSQIVRLFNECTPQIKPIVLNLVEQLSKLK